MLDPQELAHAVDLQQRSYLLLRWLGEAVKNGRVNFDSAHAYSTLPHATEMLVYGHYANIPASVRPLPDQIAEFCAFFST
jgi:hypothetical protein